MSKFRFKTVSSLQGHLKHSIMESIQTKVTDICIKVAQENIWKNVYEKYEPDPNHYDRTFELLNSVTVGNLSIGTKYATFEIYMDTDKIEPHIRTGRQVNAEGDKYGGWNSHADVFDLDMSEYIPMWIEEGTSGGLHPREGAHYMEATHFDLSGGLLAQALSDALEREGWRVVSVT